ncbi:Hypothetical protein PHPALM_1761, partial [Phytophthora palmivora]
GTLCSVVTDNAKNMKAAWEELNQKRPYIYCTGCAAHSFNLVMKDVMKISRLSGARDNAKHVAKFVRARHGLLDRFRTQQKDMTKPGGKRLALSVPIPTRWYTVEKCQRPSFKNQYVIRSVFDDNKLLKRYDTAKTRSKVERARAIVSNQDNWKEYKWTLDMLTPINKSLALCEQDQTYISSIYSEFIGLQEHAAYHTPIEGAYTDDLTSFAEIQREVLELIKGRRDKYRKEVENWTRLCFKWKRTNTKPTAFPLSPSSFWMMHGGNEFPLLKGIADKRFATPTSSASSERCWSIHDFTHTERRNRLHASRVEKLVFVYSNIIATTSESSRDHLVDDMYPDAHDGDMDPSDEDEQVMDTAEDDECDNSDEEVEAMSDVA